MSVSVEEAVGLFKAEKRIMQPIRWTDIPNRTHKSPQSGLHCRVSVKVVTPRNVFFRAVANPAYPNSFMLQVEIDQEASRSHIVLARLDACPTSAHTNPMHGPEELASEFFAAGETHEHLITDNFNSDMTSIRGLGDGLARKIDSPPSRFLSCVNYFCDRLNITNGSEIPLPGDNKQLL